MEAKEKCPKTSMVKFHQQDCQQLRSCFPNASFDTVIDTFGLCSVEDPVAMLREMARVCKPDGRVYLLEHGRSATWPRFAFSSN